MPKLDLFLDEKADQELLEAYLVFRDRVIEIAKRFDEEKLNNFVATKHVSLFFSLIKRIVQIDLICREAEQSEKKNIVSLDGI